MKRIKIEINFPFPVELPKGFMPKSVSESMKGENRWNVTSVTREQS